MEFEPVTQGETVAELVRRDIVVADHLRMRLEFGVERKQRVEHHIAVIAGDVCCRPYRIEHAQIRLGDKTQGLRVGGARRPAQTKAGEAHRSRCRREFAPRHPMSHLFPPPPVADTLAKSGGSACRASPPSQTFSTPHWKMTGPRTRPLRFLR